VVFPDGRHRWVPQKATDLDVSACEAKPKIVISPLVSEGSVRHGPPGCLSAGAQQRRRVAAGEQRTHPQVLKNPAYAGAYVYGRRSGSPQGATEAVAIQDWPVCLKDAFPGYIDWEEFMANQRPRTISITTRRTAMGAAPG
jgi:Recombinase